MNVFYLVKNSAIYLLAFISLMLSCNLENTTNIKEPQVDEKKDSNSTIENFNSVENNENNDTLFVDEKCSIFIIPDTLEIEKFKKNVNEGDFYAGTGDYLYYMNETSETINSKKLKQVNCTGKKFIKFIFRNGNQKTIDIANRQDLWMVYLFDLTSMPKQIDILNSNEEYENYFNKIQ